MSSFCLFNGALAYDLDRKEAKDGLDNHYTLSDITPKGSIPSVLTIFSVASRQNSLFHCRAYRFIREITNNVLTDIPLFMSHHRERMIEAVGANFILEMIGRY